MSTILTYGTFDLFHYGHLELLKRAKKLGTKLIVGLSTDEFNRSKNKVSKQSFSIRKENLSCINLIDLIIPENNWEQKKQDILRYKADKLVMGDDWLGKFDFLSDVCEVIYLPRTPGISSSVIKEINNK
jgi:glycerol-3-phosphate cytidylyltransferase